MKLSGIDGYHCAQMNASYQNGARSHPYCVLDEKEWVHVFAVDAKGRILLVRQCRCAADAVCPEGQCSQTPDVASFYMGLEALTHFKI
jgi:hypothetical protein